MNFLENHDEDRVTSPYFANDPFKVLSALFVSMFYNRAPFMIYAGQEFGVGPEKTSIFNFCSLEQIRHYKGKVYLCVANFDDRRVDVKVNIPSHAFECYNLEADEILSPQIPVEVSIERNAGSIVRVR